MSKIENLSYEPRPNNHHEKLFMEYNGIFKLKDL